MRIHKKRLLEAVLVSFFIALIMLGWQLLRGYILTKNIEADLFSKYASVEVLERRTSFGFTGFDWVSSIFAAGIWLAVIVVYYLARTYMDSKIKK